MGSMLVVPFGRRRCSAWWSTWPSRASCRRSGSPSRSRRSRRTCRRRSSRSGCGSPRSTVSTPARGLALVLPPGTGTGAGRPLRARALAARRAHRRPARRRSRERRAARARASARRSRRCAAGRCGAAALGRAHGLRPLARCAASSGAGWSRSRTRSSRRGAPRVDARRARASARRRADARTRRPRSTRSRRALDDGRPGRARCCSTASPAAARPRSTCAPPRRRSSAGARRSCWCRRSRSRRRPRAASWSASATPVAVLHSQLSAARALRRVGAPAPRRGARVRRARARRSSRRFDDLGLIVVDEEHDGSYKQEGDPRYDARTVAERRAARGGRGAAWPAARRRGPRASHALRAASRCPSASTAARLPPVELVGMAGRGRARCTSARATRSTRCAARGEKAIVLLNRRGWSNFLSCRLLRPRVGVPELRRDARAAPRGGRGRLPPLRPPRAGAARRAPTAARCRSRATAPAPSSSSASSRSWWRRCRSSGSTPTSRAAGGVAAVLRRFDAAPAGVLVGTQMVAKGHDFPDVTLGVVLDADATLRFPDFRAEERTFALVAQLAGPQRPRRARRPGGRPGARPRRRARCATPPRHDADGFLAGELARRELPRLPAARAPDPGRLLVRGAGPGGRGGRGRRASASRAAGVPVLGPAPLFRRQGRERAQLVVKRRDRAPAIAAVRDGGRGGGGRPRARRSVSFAVDVDPQ